MKYYKDDDKFPFLVYENSLVDGSVRWYEAYCVIGQHFELKDVDYLKTCKEITVEEYKAMTEGFYTPIEYL